MGLRRIGQQHSPSFFLSMLRPNLTCIDIFRQSREIAQTSDPTYLFSLFVWHSSSFVQLVAHSRFKQVRGNSIIPFGYHNSNVLENFTKAKLNDADRKFGKFSASALFIFCEPNFFLGNPKGTDILSLELHK